MKENEIVFDDFFKDIIDLAESVDEKFKQQLKDTDKEQNQ